MCKLSPLITVWEAVTQIYSRIYFNILDSVEEYEGGAMYISCDVAHSTALDTDSGYVPNNPLFGLSLDSSSQVE